MHLGSRRGARVILALLGLAMAALVPAAADANDHHELEATVQVPFTGAADGSRRFTIALHFPGQASHAVSWRLDIVDASGKRVRQWVGNDRAGAKPTAIELAWDGRDADARPVAHGLYQLRLVAAAGDADALDQAIAAPSAGAILAATRERAVVQEWDFVVGPAPRASMPPFVAMPRAGERTPLPRGAPAYSIYMGNLHSQTNHSDGGGDLATCNNAEGPQDGLHGPVYAFDYARARGLDFLMASEHNHLYDGSTASNAAADPAQAIALFNSGLSLAANYNSQYAGTFLALYGMEWGVTTNGGHLNIFGAPGLYGWEYGAGNGLIGDYFTARSDYAALYTLMREQATLGQFNHPDSTGQFVINGTSLAYTDDGDAVMVLAEIQNSSAFSVNTTETETSLPTFESPYKHILEAGFHVAPATNQDNHCANWGASYTNRTALLLPYGEPLNQDSFMAALRARRVFATMDRTGQIFFTAGSAPMGSRILNEGPLTLTVNYASSGGHTASLVQVYEGVPRRNGTVTLASSTAVTTLNPAPGQHFYYARITQEDGKRLWSAPIWVEQLAAGDTIFRDAF